MDEPFQIGDRVKIVSIDPMDSLQQSAPETIGKYGIIRQRTGMANGDIYQVHLNDEPNNPMSWRGYPTKYLEVLRFPCPRCMELKRPHEMADYICKDCRYGS